MPTHPLLRPSLCLAAVAAIGAMVLSVPAPAEAQSAATRYQRAQAREKTARAAASAKPETLRTIARAYEAIVRAYPRSGYADNALWQAAGLYALVFDKTADTRDRDLAARTWTWLRREYPTSPLARQAPGKIAALDSAATPRVPPSPPVSTAGSTGRSGRPAAPSRAAAPTPRPTTAPPTAAPPTLPAAATAAATAAAPAAAPPARPPARDETFAAIPLPAVGPVMPPPPTTAALAPATVPEPAAQPEPPIAVRKITHSRLPKGDRLTIEVNEEVVYAASRVGNPDRLQIDLVNAGFTSGVSERAGDLSGALVKSLQLSRTVNQSARLVIEVTGKPRYSTFPLYNPFRLVVDVEGDEPIAEDAPAPPPVLAKVAPSRATPALPTLEPGATAPVADDGPPPAAPAATSRGDFSIARQLGLGVSRIVIDPGHGGHDPGAQANGITEAALVLDVARRLEQLLLAKPGFEVVLTRQSDQFVPLEERTAIAQREHADMFISIHANSSPQAATRGIETYFLDFASTPQAEAVAARENASSAQTMRLLPELVKAITLNNKLDESRELARQVQSSLVKRLAGPNKAVKDFGVKRAPFVVLIGADMPSVLAEISFITNRSDAALLKQAAHRQRIAQALADAVLAYRGSLKKVGTVAAN